jgi:hypothetical protein
MIARRIEQQSRTANGLARGLFLVLMVLVLVACKGIDPATAPSRSFEVDLDVRTAFDRAVEQSEYCLVTDDRFPITAQIDPNAQSAFVRVNMTLSGTLLSDVRIQAITPERSRIDILMWGVDIWDMTAVDAMQAAIQFGVPACINYFPTVQTPANR